MNNTPNETTLRPISKDIKQTHELVMKAWEIIRDASLGVTPDKHECAQWIEDYSTIPPHSTPISNDAPTPSKEYMAMVEHLYDKDADRRHISPEMVGITGSQDAIEVAARVMCDVWGYSWEGDPDTDDQVAPEINDVYDDIRPTKKLYRKAAQAALSAAYPALVKERDDWQNVLACAERITRLLSIPADYWTRVDRRDAHEILSKIKTTKGGA